jgi:hypothetical protein
MTTEAEPLVTRDEIRLAMLGMVDGNGHPYSWSAIFNGYDDAAMAGCPYAAIPQYLGEQPKETLRIPDARVTHIWTDDPGDARHVAKCSLVPNVVCDPEDVIGQVDAVIVATDKGHEHVDRSRSFVEAGLPVFVDKPLVDNAGDLAIFRQWIREGRPILSSSCMRYAREFAPYHGNLADIGELRFASITTPKSWERYGIHALEAVYPILGTGFRVCRNTGDPERNVVHFKHACGADVVVVATADMFGGFGQLQLCGTKASIQIAFADTFHAFKTQLVDFVTYLRTGVRPFAFAETEELMRMVIAGILSRERGGEEINLEEI